jgi:nucleoside-diphosphate-sugar epimerase
MRVFLAGATGVIGRRLALLLRDAGNEITGYLAQKLAPST